MEWQAAAEWDAAAGCAPVRGRPGASLTRSVDEAAIRRGRCPGARRYKEAARLR